ncbi:acyltransferase family protein [Citricoccus sp. NR2]|uniref:acyltransferase family protein n=1 Tax=Citricoccus sp. NR2 TaxID=3004095 RepID=UPI0022DE5955|nr:acyltransferase [Citricoccus sp. NR2]WBL20556.1 acyltransferase [Citricoccus sp. NR2]
MSSLAPPSDPASTTPTHSESASASSGARTVVPAAGGEPRRLAALDITRLVAALAVVLFHWTAFHHTYWDSTQREQAAGDVWPGLSVVTSWGNFGVQLFFLISGFVILLSCWGRSPARFIASRVGRLYPAYLVAVLAAALLQFVIWPQMGTNRETWEILPNLTMFQGGMPGVGHLDAVYWTLWVELKFYLLMTVFCWLGITARRVLILAVAWPVAGQIVQVVGPMLGVPDWLRDLLQQVMFPEYAALFAGGMVLYLVYREGHSLARWGAIGLNAVIAAATSATTAMRETPELTGHHHPWWGYWIVVGALFAVVAMVTLTPCARWRIPGASIAGNLTYPVYLLHQLWGWWIISLLSEHLPAPVVLLIALGAVVVAAALVHRWVERSWGPRLRSGTLKLLEPRRRLGPASMADGAVTSAGTSAE